MPKRGGSVHVATIQTKGRGDRVYTSHLLRRSYREDGKVKHENLGNLSHLPPEAISAVKATLAGKALVDLDEALSIERSLPHGHVAAVLGVLRELDLERLISRERSRERDLVVAMIVQRLIGPGSKLSATRRFGQTTLASELDLGEVTEAELLGAMDWLLERQQRIEKALAKRHLAGEGFMLYDLSSSYVEGRKCPLASLGYSRDGKKGTAQVNYGLTCSPEGRPIAICVHEGNVTDQRTVTAAIEAVRERFAISDVVFVGDRGMMTKAHAEALTKAGVEFVSALKSAQIRKLLEAGDVQLSLFDETNLAEITSEQFPGERLVICRNPALAADRKRKRDELLAATEAQLDKVRCMVEGPRGTLRTADAGKIGTRAGKVVNKYKMAKHFDLRIADGAFAFERKQEQINTEAALDGLYAIRTTCPETKLSTSESVVRTYKQLKMAERAFRTMKDQIEIRPIHHHLEDRVRAHAFICMLAYYVAFELHLRLAPLLFTDEAPHAPADPVAEAERSASAKAKASSAQTPDGFAAHSFVDLIAELGTLCRNEVRFGAAQHTFSRPTKATELQARALELVAVKLPK